MVGPRRFALRHYRPKRQVLLLHYGPKLLAGLAGTVLAIALLGLLLGLRSFLKLAQGFIKVIRLRVNNHALTKWRPVYDPGRH